MGLLGLACICSTIVVVDGPLIQRASGIIPVPNSAVMLLNVTMTPEIPHTATGGWVTPEEAGYGNVGLVFNNTIITANGTAPTLVEGLTGYRYFYDAIYGWRYNSPLGGVISGCAGECQAKMRAPAMFPVDCKTDSLPVDFNIIYTAAGRDQESHPPLESDAFAVATRLLVDGQESISLFAAFATINNNFTGTLQYRTCIFRAGIGEYSISIQDDQIMMESLENPTFVAFANNTDVDHTFSQAVGGYPSTLSGIVNSMIVDMDSLVTYYRTNVTHGPLEPFLDGTLCQQFAYGNGDFFNEYSDPFDFVANRMNRLMVYMGGAIASHHDADYYNTHYMDPGLSAHTVINGAVQGMVNVYHTTYWWFLGAALIELLCIAVVGLTYWGWWRMGRPVSLSPLEIAKVTPSSARSK